LARSASDGFSVQLSIINLDRANGEVDLQIMDAPHRSQRGVFATAQRAQIGAQLLGIDRMSQADIGAGVEAVGAVVCAAVARQQNDDVLLDSRGSPARQKGRILVESLIDLDRLVTFRLEFAVGTIETVNRLDRQSFPHQHGQQGVFLS
jgi:hypothetical protein